MTEPNTQPKHRKNVVGSWVSVPGQWPRRLLHIPTMTSVERGPHNIYGGEHEPDYSILSYTWGRWMINDGSRLIVNGLTWEIPAVDENAAFTVADFQRVLETMGKSTSWAWVDVACIDQADDLLKMEEIGRQVGIFANAAHVYAWLWRRPGNVLQAAIDDIVRYCNYLIPRDTENVHPGRDLLAVLMQITKSTDEILGDWWFSSLWTLQEGVLRSDAVVLGHDGQPLKYELPGGGSCDLLCRYIYSCLWHIQSELTVGQYRRTFEAPSLRPLADAIFERIARAGFAIDPFADNPNLQYAAAASRVTSYPLDRIYGIVSIYNLRIGSMKEGDQMKTYTFEELEDEFAATLNAYSPLLGQMFIQKKKPRQDRSWQITQNIRIPRSLNGYRDQSTRLDCEIVGTVGGWARIKGRTCPLTKISDFWQSMRKHLPLHVIIDDYLCGEYNGLPFLGDKDYGQDRHTEDAHVIVAAVLRVFPPERLSVFALGLQQVGEPNAGKVGLLLLHSSQDRQRCERLGVCVWGVMDNNASGGGTITAPEWVSYEGDLH